jgi:hypothetical protein
MIQPWSKIVDFYDRVAIDRPSMHAMARLARFISETHLARGLFAWTAMHDLCIVQTEVTYPYDGPRLVISPLAADQIEFRYVDTFVTAKQWHRIVDFGQAVPRLLGFLEQLRWFPAEVLKSLDDEAG